ncbi:DUF6582 domain-containing protein [Mycolicibacter heraklionensis]|uniref:DUF6582 domain-containing protein n=1 Tax=Mycolicibacter heraklionensis TaxID=512402 RepID=UPI00069BF60C|nr:DUF6582 domain-containing protein [Mycolicibacter heraklionensis]
MVNLKTVKDRELMRVGNYKLRSGDFSVTRETIAAAVAAHEAGILRKPTIRLGHGDPRFTGDPAVGFVDNLSTSEDGDVLYGDLAGVPEWLADIMPSAYPSLSIEGQEDYTDAAGEQHDFVLTGLALLGATPPGIDTLKSVQDVAELYQVAAAREIGGTAVAFTVEASTFRDRTDAKEPWGDVDYADPGYLDRDDQPAEPGHGVKRYPLNDRDHVKSAWSFINEKKNQKPYTATQLDHIKSAIEKAAAKFSIKIEAAAAVSQQEGAAMALPEKIAAALGIAADADEDAVTAAWDAHVAATEAEAAQRVAAAAAPAAGVMQIEASVYDQLRSDAEAGRVARDQQIADEDTRTVEAAIAAGKIAPARKDHWLEALKADREGNKQVLAALAPGLIPVAEMGHSIPAPEGGEDNVAQQGYETFMSKLGFNPKGGN